MTLKQTYSKALVIGAGSGRDMGSAILLTEELRKQGTKTIDLAGFLTPWALHTFNNKLENPINALNLNSKKFIPLPSAKNEINFYFEPELIQLNREFKLGIDQLYVFSLQYGTKAILRALEELISRNNYDLIIAVDVGGDALARKKDFPSLITPFVDLTCIEILSRIKHKVTTKLAIIAPGVDGEINFQGIVEIFEELKKNNALEDIKIEQASESYQKFVKINEEIEKRTGSKSNTIRIIKSALNGETKIDLTREFRIGEKEWKISFPANIVKDLVNKIFFLDINKLKMLRNNFNIWYNNILDAVLKFRKNFGGCEVDLSYIPTSIDNYWYNDVLFILTPNCNIKEDIRKEMLEYGISIVLENKMNALMLKKDGRLVTLPNKLLVKNYEDFYLLSGKN
ncbi:MAG: DUF1152 domain-containing protein [Candidatus Bilamarchaeaceae archaeon]